MALQASTACYRGNFTFLSFAFYNNYESKLIFHYFRETNVGMKTADLFVLCGGSCRSSCDAWTLFTIVQM
jgi:hypothetical protein